MNKADVVSRPVLFSTPMIQALLEGRKTQTRRLVNQKPNKQGLKLVPELMQKIGVGAACPYGKVGDLLWVRENWATSKDSDSVRPSHLAPAMCQLWYAADEKFVDSKGGINFGSYVRGKTRPNIFMPKWASRLTLKIADIRVERLQNISKKDALGEGVVRVNNSYLMDPSLITAEKNERYWGNDNPRGAFFTYFEKLRGSELFDSNPWVWVLEFEVYKCNFRELLSGKDKS